MITRIARSARPTPSGRRKSPAKPERQSPSRIDPPEGEATAEAIKARAAALANNPLLVELTKAEKWDGQLPTSMIPGSTVPFLELSAPAVAPN
jgi:hypothetical protein